jgi:hypothetical protein
MNLISPLCYFRICILWWCGHNGSIVNKNMELLRLRAKLFDGLFDAVEAGEVEVKIRNRSRARCDLAYFIDSSNSLQFRTCC